MADVMSRAKRSALMSRIRSKDTQPERALRSALRRAGVRFRSYRRIQGVKVDIVLTESKVALLVHGCFWHGCRWHYVPPRDHAAFWKTKLAENRARDRRQEQAIKLAGWTPVVMWEHALREDPDRALKSALMRLGVGQSSKLATRSW